MCICVLSKMRGKMWKNAITNGRKKGPINLIIYDDSKFITFIAVRRRECVWDDQWGYWFRAIYKNCLNNTMSFCKQKGVNSTEIMVCDFYSKGDCSTDC